MMRSAIIGCGSIAGVHAAALSQSDRAQLSACADIPPDRARPMADAHQILAYPSLDALLAQERLDALHICTPHHLHVAMAMEALSGGIPVFSVEASMHNRHLAGVMEVEDTVRHISASRTPPRCFTPAQPIVRTRRCF